MRKFKLILLPLLLGITACSTATGNSINIDEHAKAAEKSASLGSFNLLTPVNNMIVESIDEFTWEESTNAETYTLEICSSDMFVSNIDTIDYYSKANITSTSFKINSSFAFKETNYYWRVTAKNSSSEKECNAIGTFFIKAPSVEEVKFDLGENDDWTLHPLGSYADILVSDTNFFGEKDKALKISFKEEYTHRGNPESDGWIVVTKTFEKSIYGTDALYFNCFYAGQDSTIQIRLVDRDNEFWYCYLQISTNAKQSIILKFSDFVQRTGDVIVANQTFDYERIKYVEVVFERTFGDGVFLISGMKAIKFDNYKDLFITKLNFNDYDETKYVFENYNFEHQVNNDYELEMSYYGTNELNKPKINGYGFLKINVNRYMFTGDAIKISIKYTGNPGSNIVLRVYEEDTDRWSIRIPFKNFTADEYKTLVIPYGAFGKSSMQGDGKRQFYYILNLQFGLEGEYSAGKLFFKDFEVVEKADYAKETKRVVGEDGLIENFNNYEFSSDMYFIWDETESNKDEYMSLNSTDKVGGSENPYCGQFEYKGDMEQAGYTLPVEVNKNYSAISLWLKDQSVKSLDVRVNELTDFRPDIHIYIRLVTKEIYLYTISSLARSWKEYVIPFEDFELTNDNELASPAQPIAGTNITHIAIGMQFFYTTFTGGVPVYSNSNPVLLDNIYFTNQTENEIIDKERVITMEGDIANLEDAETYKNTDQAASVWTNGRGFDYEKVELSDNVSKEGGHNSLKMQYQTNSDSPAYYMAPAIDDTVKGRGIRVHLKADLPATVYFNIYLNMSGNTYQYRATINNVTTEWTEYVIGFENFTIIGSTSSTRVNATNLIYITRISFGMVYNHGTEKELSYVYMDNLKFDYSLEYDDLSTRVIA